MRDRSRLDQRHLRDRAAVAEVDVERFVTGPFARRHRLVQRHREAGVTQSRVSDQVRGKHEKFSLDMLVTLAARAGRTVKLRLAA